MKQSRQTAQRERAYTEMLDTLDTQQIEISRKLLTRT